MTGDWVIGRGGTGIRADMMVVGRVEVVYGSGVGDRRNLRINRDGGRSGEVHRVNDFRDWTTPSVCTICRLS